MKTHVTLQFGKAPTSPFDFDRGALMLALAFFIWARRARA
jgi:hypothetical protein